MSCSVIKVGRGTYSAPVGELRIEDGTNFSSVIFSPHNGNWESVWKFNQLGKFQSMEHRHKRVNQVVDYVSEVVFVCRHIDPSKYRGDVYMRIPSVGGPPLFLCPDCVNRVESDDFVGVIDEKIWREVVLPRVNVIPTHHD